MSDGYTNSELEEMGIYPCLCLETYRDRSDNGEVCEVCVECGASGIVHPDPSSKTTTQRERVLHLVREERARQIKTYGLNDDLLLGFGSNVSAYPWLLPFDSADSDVVEGAFRYDYESYVAEHGKPTWMHLIREEVAELFDAEDCHHALEEAVQVAALCVSLCEKLMAEYEGK